MLLGDRATGRRSHLGRRSTRRAKACSSRSTSAPLVPKMTPVGEAGTQGLGRAGERHLLSRAGIDQRVVAVGDVPVVAAMDGKVADWLRHFHDALEPGLSARQALDGLRIARKRAGIDRADQRRHGTAARTRGLVAVSPGSSTVPLTETRQGLKPCPGLPNATRLGNLFGDGTALGALGRQQ